MKCLKLDKYFNVQIVYDTYQQFYDKDHYNNLLFYYQSKNYPLTILSKNGIDFDLSSKFCIKCVGQIITINQKVTCLFFAGTCIMFPFKEKIQFVYEENEIEKKDIKFANLSFSAQESIGYLFGRQKKDSLDYSHILYHRYDDDNKINNYIYYYSIKCDSTKKLKHIILPNNELMFILAITVK